MSVKKTAKYRGLFFTFSVGQVMVLAEYPHFAPLFFAGF